uniref:Uncharacterized protein n=1 Tax=Monopterus albus TaxID=43700 RepID=A0A3Q3IES5_MONAL
MFALAGRSLASNQIRKCCGNITYKFEHVPVEDIVVGEALSVEEVPEQLAEIRVVGFVVEPQRAAKVQVGGKLQKLKYHMVISIQTLCCDTHIFNLGAVHFF